MTDEERHFFATMTDFRVEWTYGNQPQPHTTSHVQGFLGVLSEIKSWNHSLTMDEMFRIFIDNKAKKHSVIFVGDKGELVTTIRIVVEDT